MSSISSMSGVNSSPYMTGPTESTYETNSKSFGPAAATVMGAVDAGGAAVSSVVSFSEEALKKVGDSLEAGYDAVKSGVNDVTSEISHLASEAGDSIKTGYNEVADALNSVGTSISNAAGSVSDTVGSAVSTVGQYAALGAAAAKNLVSEVV